VLTDLIKGINGIGQDIHKHLIQLSRKNSGFQECHRSWPQLQMSGRCPLGLETMAQDQHGAVDAFMEVESLLGVRIRP
jgi:hypothetical protein